MTTKSIMATIPLTDEIVFALSNQQDISEHDITYFQPTIEFIASGMKCVSCGSVPDEVLVMKNHQTDKVSLSFSLVGERFSISTFSTCKKCNSKKPAKKIAKTSPDEQNDYSYEDAEYKNYQLVDTLIDYRETFCNEGTRKIKLKLNKLIKQGDIDAKILRTLLETEDANVTAKRYRGQYKTSAYDKKSELLKECVQLFKANKLTHGFQKCNNYSCNNILYFEYNGTQFSWHSNATHNAGKYAAEWDGLENSTLPKLESLISKHLTTHIPNFKGI